MGIYLVTFSYDGLPGDQTPGLLHRKVEAYRFIDVEDWAHENAPDGYYLWSIEKVYHSGADEMYGSTDVSIEWKQ